MRFYKLAGSEQYVSWDTLHNVAGYSEQATNEITWKSVENWGTSAGTGYELPVELFGDSELFMDNVFGWHDLDWFALEQSVYPSTASDMVLTHPTYGSSPVVFMVFEDGTYYLIQKDIAPGWMTEEEYSARGWQLPGYIVLNSETGAILGAAKGHELETVPIPVCTMASPEMECVPIPARVLASPGMVVYVPTVVELPTVSRTKSWFTTTQTSKTVQPGYNALYDDNGAEVLYDNTKTYVIDPTTGSVYVEGGSLREYNGKLSYYCTNQFGISGSYWCRYYTCNTSEITVSTVYNSSNVTYNAFKYTTNSTDYYYVLDGTQTDWTDDLSSIGYSLTQQVKVAYFNQNKTTQSLGTFTRLDLYDVNGNQIPSYIDTTYTTTGVFYGNGTEIQQFKDGGGTLHLAKDCISPVNVGGVLYADKAYTVLYYSDSWATAGAAYITYTES